MCFVPLSVSLGSAGLCSRSLNVCCVFCAWVRGRALSIRCFLVSAIILYNQIFTNYQKPNMYIFNYSLSISFLFWWSKTPSFRLLQKKQNLYSIWVKQKKPSLNLKRNIFCFLRRIFLSSCSLLL